MVDINKYSTTIGKIPRLVTGNTFGTLPVVDFVKPLYLFLGGKIKWAGAKDCHYIETRPDNFRKVVKS